MKTSIPSETLRALQRDLFLRDPALFEAVDIAAIVENCAPQISDTVEMVAGIGCGRRVKLAAVILELERQRNIAILKFNGPR